MANDMLRRLILLLIVFLFSLSIIGMAKSVDDEPYTITNSALDSAASAIIQSNKTSASSASTQAAAAANTAASAVINSKTPGVASSTTKQPAAQPTMQIVISSNKSLSVEEVEKSDYVIAPECIRICKAEKVNVGVSISATTAASAASATSNSGQSNAVRPTVISEECETVCKNKSVIVRKKAEEVVKEVITGKQVCSVSPSNLRQLNGLIMRMKKAENNELLNESVDSIKQEIERLRKVMIAEMQQCKLQAVNTSTAAGSSGIAVKVDACSELKAWTSKRDYYLSIANLSADATRIIAELEEGIKKLRLECEQDIVTVTAASTTVTAASTIMAADKPSVLVENATQISEYYKLKIARILENESDSDNNKLRKAKEEMANLTAVLVQKSDSDIAVLDEFIDEIVLSAGTASVNGVKVSTVKRINATIKNRHVVVQPSASGAILSDATTNAWAKEFTVTSDGVKLGNATISITPSEAVVATGATATTVALNEENGKAVYKIESKENRKLLWLIPVEVDGSYKVSAEDGAVLSSELPWWSFLAMK
jgi:hypothetical protein